MEIEELNIYDEKVHNKIRIKNKIKNCDQHVNLFHVNLTDK